MYHLIILFFLIRNFKSFATFLIDEHLEWKQLIRSNLEITGHKKNMIPVGRTFDLNFQTCKNFANFANLDKHKAYCYKNFIKSTVKRIQIYFW